MSGRILYFDTTRLYCAAALLVAVLTLVCATRAISEDTCIPALAIGDVHFTEMQPLTLSRTWSAVVSVDASHCPEKATGTFDIVFIREKGNRARP